MHLKKKIVSDKNSDLTHNMSTKSLTTTWKKWGQTLVGNPREGVGTSLSVIAQANKANYGATGVLPLNLFIYLVVDAYNHRPTVGHLVQQNTTTRSLEG